MPSQSLCLPRGALRPGGFSGRMVSYPLAATPAPRSEVHSETQKKPLLTRNQAAGSPEAIPSSSTCLVGVGRVLRRLNLGGGRGVRATPKRPLFCPEASPSTGNVKSIPTSENALIALSPPTPRHLEGRRPPPIFITQRESTPVLGPHTPGRIGQPQAYVHARRELSSPWAHSPRPHLPF